VVATRNSPTTYYEDRTGGLAGIEYELAVGFAEAHDLEIEFVVLDGIGEILEAVEKGEVDIAAAGLTRTPARARAYLTGPGYQSIEEQVVCNRRKRVRSVEDLYDKEIRIIGSSSYEERLRQLQASYPRLAWTTTKEESTEELLQLVWSGKVDCTVADSNILALDRRFLPSLKTPFSLGPRQSLTWFVAEGAADLMEPLDQWFESIYDTGRLDALIGKYYSHVENFDFYDTAMFFRRIRSRLPAYEEMFVIAESQTDLDWRLLASVAYQESHWNPDAESFTGVRGLMMLTQETAADVGVDRLDPLASVLGGAIYLNGLIRRIPTHIEQPDRLWLALAAYNVGYSHLEDARKLAVELGENPNTWEGVKAVLPKLSQPRFYRKLRHGYARGSEPVMYVERVRNYYDLLAETMPRERPDEVPSGILTSAALIAGKSGSD
jgi:membrane-bound lytic murein transglycosylase F